MKIRCTDQYGNLDTRLKKGAVVESDIAIFTVGEIYKNGLVSMNKEKPYKIKDFNNPMTKCVEAGNYAVIAPLLVFSSLEKQTNADRIRSMSDEELAELFDKVKLCGALSFGEKQN